MTTAHNSGPAAIVATTIAELPNPTNMRLGQFFVSEVDGRTFHVVRNVTGQHVWKEVPGTGGGGIPAQQGRIWYVDAAAAALGANGSPLNQFPTIALALAAAANGDEIVLAPGTYPESPVITKLGLSLVSDGGAILDGLTLAGASGEYLLDGITVATGGVVFDTGGPVSTAVVYIVRSSINGNGVGINGLWFASPGWVVSVRDSMIAAVTQAPAISISAPGVNLTIRNSSVVADMPGFQASLYINDLSSVVRGIGTRFSGRVQATVETLASFDGCEFYINENEDSYFVAVPLVLFTLYRGNKVSGMTGPNVLASGTGGRIRAEEVIADSPLSVSGVSTQSPVYTSRQYSLLNTLNGGGGPVFVPAECGDTVLITNNPGNVNVNLPKGNVSLVGKRITIKNYARSGTLTMVPSFGNTIDGVPSVVVNADAIAPGIGFTSCTVQLNEPFVGTFDWVVVSP